MNDLVQFLRDQLDEDEQIAKAATQGDWVWSREFVTPPGYHHRTVGPLEPGDAAYIAEHAPARVLLEIEAKRDLLHFAQGIYDYHETFTTGVASRLEKTLRLFALAYADRPGYRAEWRP